MDLSKDLIIEELVRHSDDLKNFGLVQLGLFGSSVRNESTENSDIDFIADFDPAKKSYKNYIRLVYYLEHLFGREVDLITKDALPKNRDFTENITKEVSYVSFVA
jgi:predicted nucleotidyltransferase